MIVFSILDSSLVDSALNEEMKPKQWQGKLFMAELYEGWTEQRFTGGWRLGLNQKS
jgi:hypothetical protein